MGDSNPDLTLMGMPREIRLEILRHLLWSPHLVRAYTHYYLNQPTQGRNQPMLDFHPKVLRTNKQIYYEGLGVLYGENWFHINIRDWNGEYVEFLGVTQFSNTVDKFMPQYHRIKHYDISIQLLHEEEVFFIKKGIRSVALKLSEVPPIHGLRITYEDDTHKFRVKSHNKNSSNPVPKPYDFAHVLQPFTLLRNVGRIEVSGSVGPRYSQYIADIIKGSTPVDLLPKMYHALEHLAKPFNEFEHIQRQACNAMEEDDVERFKRIRTRLARRILKRTMDGFNRLYDYDAEAADQQVEFTMSVAWKGEPFASSSSSSESD